MSTPRGAQLDHCGSSANQLKQIFSRAFFRLDMDTKARNIVENCHTCVSLKPIPTNYHKQSTSAASKTIASKFSSDVIKRYSQNILVVREDITSYTDAVLVENVTLKISFRS